MKAVVSIAGSDSSGGAGIQADIKTIAAHHLFAETVITALTAQNTLGVTRVHEVPAAFVSEQIDAVFSDIRPDAVKVGMVSSAEIIRAIAGGLDKWHAENIVVDPVMVANALSAKTRCRRLSGSFFPGRASSPRTFPRHRSFAVASCRTRNHASARL